MGLGARLALLFAALAAATALLVGGASYLTTDREVEAGIDKFLRDRADDIADDDRRGDGRRRNDRNDFDDDLFGAGNEAEVQFLDKSGAIAANSGLELPVTSTDTDIAENGSDPRLRTIVLGTEQFRMITQPLPGGGAVQVARSLDEAQGLVSVLQTRQLVIALALAIGGGAVGWIVAQRTTRPLRALSSAVEEVAETQDFTVPVNATGRDEVGRLARGFDRMLGALQESREQQRRLVQDAAHELRTPLTSITANVDWLLRADDLDPDTRGETLGSIKRELTELNDVMGEIIELATDSHREAELVATDLAAVASDAVARFRRRSGRIVELVVEPTMVEGDAESLERAATNLLSNADKYSPAGAGIRVRVSPAGLFVDDAGPGIPVAERPLVLERFYRRDEDRSKPGSGLGLSIVSGIVDVHGGSMSIGDSDLGGASVGFRLPSRPAARPPSRPRSER